MIRGVVPEMCGTAERCSARTAVAQWCRTGSTSGVAAHAGEDGLDIGRRRIALGEDVLHALLDLILPLRVRQHVEALGLDRFEDAVGNHGGRRPGGQELASDRVLQLVAGRALAPVGAGALYVWAGGYGPVLVGVACLAGFSALAMIGAQVTARTLAQRMGDGRRGQD